MFLFPPYFLPVYQQWEKTMDPDFLNVFTQPAAVNQYLAENVIAQGMYFMNQDSKRAKEWLEEPSRKCAVQTNHIFFSSGPMVLSAVNKLCACNLAADSLEADHEEATQILAGSFTEI